MRQPIKWFILVNMILYTTKDAHASSLTCDSWADLKWSGTCKIKYMKKKFGNAFDGSKAKCGRQKHLNYPKSNKNSLAQCRAAANAINKHGSYNGYPVSCNGASLSHQSAFGN